MIYRIAQFIDRVNIDGLASLRNLKGKILTDSILHLFTCINEVVFIESCSMPHASCMLYSTGVPIDFEGEKQFMYIKPSIQQ